MKDVVEFEAREVSPFTAFLFLLVVTVGSLALYAIWRGVAPGLLAETLRSQRESLEKTLTP